MQETSEAAEAAGIQVRENTNLMRRGFYSNQVFMYKAPKTKGAAAAAP
jgi:hypothetical protein